MQEEQETIWYLEDARELAEAAPYTFYVPSPEVIARLRPGDMVKLIFRYDEDGDVSGEALWLRLSEVDGDEFIGLLDSAPASTPDLQVGDEIEFNIYHIVDTQLEDPVPNIVQQYAPGCFVTRRVYDDEHPVAALYRESPDDLEEEMPNFSGWNIMAGDEDDDYLDNPDNWVYVPLGSVLDIDDRIIDVLDAPYDSEFVYDPESDSFVEVEDDED
jgi:hypothetical protein